MGSPFVGEIRMFGGNFAPQGWALCQGQLMPIAETTRFTPTYVLSHLSSTAPDE